MKPSALLLTVYCPKHPHHHHHQHTAALLASRCSRCRCMPFFLLCVLLVALLTPPLSGDIYCIPTTYMRAQPPQQHHLLGVYCCRGHTVTSPKEHM